MHSITVKAVKRFRLLANRHAHINWTLVDQAVVSASNFFIALIVARYLGIEAFGIFSVAWLILLFAQSLQIALILTPMLSIGPKADNDQQLAYYSSLLSLQLAFALVSAAVSALLVAYAGQWFGMGETGEMLALPLAFAVVASQLHEFIRRACYARTLPATALVMDLARYLGQFALFFYLFTKGYGALENILYTIAMSALLGLVVAHHKMPLPLWCLEKVLVTTKRHWNMSKWLVPSALMQWTSGNFFTLAAGAILGPAAVGAMRAAQNLMGVTHVFFQAMDNWAPVRASGVHMQQGVVGLRAFTRKLLLLTGVATVLVALFLAVPAEFWLTLLYGGEYAHYDWLVAYYGVTYVLMALSYPLRYALLALENTRPIFIGYAVSTIVTMALVYPFISVFGLTGAMLGILFTQMVMLSNFIVFYKKKVVN